MVQPNFTVNIATFNQLDNLKLIIEALKMQTLSSFEVIVCDDGSSDGTKEWAKDQDFDYFWQEHDGFQLAKSKNNGIRAANGEYFVSLEADVVPHPELLEEFSKHLGERTVQLGVRHDVQMWPNKLDFNLFDKYIISKDFRLPSLDDWEKVDRPWRFVSGCNLCIPTKILQDIGGWNEDFHAYGIDDYEVGLRLMMAGCTIIPTISAYGYHLRHDLRPTSDENIKILDDLERKYHASSY